MRALILTGGYGTRLGELTRQCPKPLLEVAGRPLLWHILSNLAASGVEDIVANACFMPDALQDFVDGHSEEFPGLRIHRETSLRGTAGTLRDLATVFEASDEPFVVHYGDILTDADLRPLLEAASGPDRVGAILLHRRVAAQSIARLEGGVVRSFEERPDWNGRTPEEVLTFSGIAAFTPRIFPWLESLDAKDLPRDVFPSLARNGLLRGVETIARRFAIDSPERLASARDAWEARNRGSNSEVRTVADLAGFNPRRS